MAARNKLLTLALALMGGLLLSGQRRAVDEAWDLLAKGERSKAEQALRRIVATDKQDAEARLMLGSLLAEDANWRDAMVLMEAALRLRPQWAEAHQALGEALRETGEPVRARHEFEQAVKFKPDFAQARVDLGLALLSLGEGKAAIPHLDRAIALWGREPDAAYPMYLRAKINTEQGEFDRAVDLLARAVALRPDFAEAWSDLGQARKNLQDFAGALAAFQRSVQADAGNAVSQYRLGAEYLRQGDAGKAVEHLQRSYALNPKDQSMLYSLQMALRQTGQVEAANRMKAELAEVLKEIDRESQRAFRALGLNNEGAALEKTGDLRAAMEKYREAMALDPEHNGIRVNFSVAALKLGMWREGIAALQEAARREPRNVTVQTALEDALRQAPREFGGQGGVKKQ